MKYKLEEVLPLYRDMFVAELHFMHGDADGSTDVEIKIGAGPDGRTSEDSLQQFLTDLDVLIKLDALSVGTHPEVQTRYKNFSRLGNYTRTDFNWDEVRRMPEYTRWFLVPDEESGVVFDDEGDLWGEELWPCDNPEYCPDEPASLVVDRSFVYWYDKAGKKFKVVLEA